MIMRILRTPEEKAQEKARRQRLRAEPVLEQPSELLLRFRAIEKGRFEGHIHEVGDVPYKFFRPSHHVKTGLIDDGVFSSLRRGKNMLTVGCGPAYLEQCLAILGVVRGNLVLSDKTRIDLEDIGREGVPRDMEFHQFDMLGTWPDFRRLFDYLIFPDAFGVVFELMGRPLGAPYEQARPEGAIISAFNNENSSMVAHNHPDKISGICSITERITHPGLLERQRHVIRESLSRLHPGGQIRIGGLQIPYNQLCHLHQRMRGEYSNLEAHSELAIITK